MQRKGIGQTKSEKIYKRHDINIFFFKNEGEVKLENLTLGIQQ